VDLVGHEGGLAVKDFTWTLTVTNRSTGWTEGGAVRTKAEIYVIAALASCLRRYPGRVVSLHSDNGSEFMNGHLTRFCHAQGTTFTRSRPYHKNDKCCVESRNWTPVRRYLGYRRFNTEDQLANLQQLGTLLALRAPCRP
jgi:hypothetical protein